MPNRLSKQERALLQHLATTTTPPKISPTLKKLARAGLVTPDYKQLSSQGLRRLHTENEIDRVTSQQILSLIRNMPGVQKRYIVERLALDTSEVPVIAELVKHGYIRSANGKYFIKPRK